MSIGNVVFSGGREQGFVERWWVSHRHQRPSPRERERLEAKECVNHPIELSLFSHSQTTNQKAKMEAEIKKILYHILSFFYNLVLNFIFFEFFIISNIFCLKIFLPLCTLPSHICIPLFRGGRKPTNYDDPIFCLDQGYDLA